MMQSEREISSEAAMEAFGADIANAATGGFAIFLSGQLAAGKTTFARGYLRARGHRGAVKSPTFTLVETYVIDAQTIHHFDLYRIEDAEELEYLGLDEYFDGAAQVLVEWPERGEGALPRADLEISFTLSASMRTAVLRAHSIQGREVLDSIER